MFFYKDKGIDKVFIGLNYVILSLFLFIVLYPLIYIVSASFSSGYAVASGQVWLLPVDFTLDGYKAVFKDSRILMGYLNSLFLLTFGTFFNVVLTIMAAYPLSRKDFRPGNVIMFMFVFTMMFKPGTIPEYIVVNNLGLYDSRWALILPKAIMVYNLIITRTYFKTTIPNELLEASRLDGCSDFKFILNIVLPLSKSIIAVIALFYGVAHWNRYFDALLFINSANKLPLQMILRDILVANQVDSAMIGGDVINMAEKQNLSELLKYSLIVVSALPFIVLYPFIQKYFAKGVMIGAIKG